MHLECIRALRAKTTSHLDDIMTGFDCIEPWCLTFEPE